VDADAIVDELIRLQRREPELGLDLFQSLVSARQYRALYLLLQQFVQPGAAVLDWGCGNGHFSYVLDRLGYRAHGYSFGDVPLVRHLSSRYTFTRGRESDPTTLPYRSEQFDAVVSVGVLEHVRETGGDELASLHEIRRILRPGGHFICYHLPNFFSYIEAAAAIIPRIHHHAYRFTPRDVHRWCDRVPLELLMLERYGALPRNPWQVVPVGRVSRRLADTWDALDRVMGVVMAPVVQNYRFVARKAGNGAGAEHQLRSKASESSSMDSR
jgi:SAM-dependent methyltransferase